MQATGVKGLSHDRSGFYSPKSGIKIGRNFLLSFGLRFSSISDSSFPLHFGLLLPLGKKFC